MNTTSVPNNEKCNKLKKIRKEWTMVNLGTKIEIENIQLFSNNLLASLTTSIILKFAKKLPTLDVPYKAILVLRLN